MCIYNLENRIKIIQYFRIDSLSAGWQMAGNASFDVSLCGNMTEQYLTIWSKYEFWCEGILFSSLGLFGNFGDEQTLVF